MGQLFGFLGIFDDQGVQKTRAADLELCLVLSLRNLDGAGVLSAGLLKKIADIDDLFRL